MDPLEARLMARVIKRPSGCWEWMGARTTAGYGNIRVGGRIDGKTHLTHRLAYQLFVGPIPERHDLHHLCENRPCLNPEHLQPVPHLDHMQLLATAKSDRCARGHLFDEQNTGKRPWHRNGRRICLACKRLRYAERKRAALG